MGTHFALGSFLGWIIGWRSPAPTPTTWHANEERGAALHCAARKIREIHAPLLLDVGCWILAAVIWITDRSSCSLVSFYTMMRPAVHWRGFSYPAPRRRTKIERDREHRLLASPECFSIMSSVSYFLFPLCSPPDAPRHANFAHPKSAFSNCPSYLILSARSTAVSQDIHF